MYTIRKKFKFESAHQLFHAYTTLCSGTIHGHSYIVEIFFQSEDLDSTGMVIDFGEVKDILKSFIDDYLDHSLMMPETLPQDYIEKLKIYNDRLIILPFNPTAENIAKYIYDEGNNILAATLRVIHSERVKLSKVRVWETETGWAEYE